MSNRLKILSMDTIERKFIEWLWYPYIPLSKITIIQGDPGEGKTTFALTLAASYSCGRKIGNNDNTIDFDPINIIYQTAEDGLADTIRPRLDAAGADCSRIKVIDDTEKSLCMSDERIEKAIIETNAKLLILDPLQAYLGSNVDMNRANDMRGVTKKLSAVAEKTGCAIVLIGHMNKSSMSKATYRGIGSIDIFAVARSVLLVGRVPEQPDVRAVAQIKNNLAPTGNTIAFKFNGDKFEYDGEHDITVDELLGANLPGDKLRRAEELLIELLSNGKLVHSQAIIRKGKELGISKRTIENAKLSLGVESIRKGSSWYWKLC